MECQEACGLESSLSESAFDTFVQSISDNAFGKEPTCLSVDT